jgi:hypothetical protein
LRLNERTVELAVASSLPEDERAADMAGLSQRQRRLADLARRMNERE